MKESLIKLSLRNVTAGRKYLQPRTWRDYKGFKNDIASVQQLVLESARSVRWFARERALHHSVVSALFHEPLL